MNPPPLGRNKAHRTSAKLVQNPKLIIVNYCKQGLFPLEVLIIITLEGMFAFC